IFVICAKAPKLYQTVDASGTIPPRFTNHAIANCPVGTAVLGGGVLNGSSSVLSNIGDAFPAGNSFRADVTNGTNNSVPFSARAICARKPKGYPRGVGADTPISAHSSAIAQAFCPGVTVPMGGGVLSFLDDQLAGLNASFPTNADGWAGVINNNSIGNATIS